MSDSKKGSFWNEHWKSINFGGLGELPVYEVSNYGRLRSFRSTTEGTIIQGSVIQGYRSLNIRVKGKTFNRYIHKMVAECFLERPSAGQTYVIHLDHDKQNNRAANLRWVTKEAMVEHNRANPNVLNRPLPKRTRNYKLTESKVMVIKKLLRNNKNRLKMIARQFGITHTQLNRIRSGENWKHVVLDDEPFPEQPSLPKMRAVE